jgi:hypothetical protein
MTLNTIGDWSAFLQAVGALATALIAAVGLVVVVMELRSLRVSINGNSSAQVYTYMLDLLRLQIEYPELRRYVYGGQSPPTDETGADRVAAFLGAFDDFIEFVYAQRRLGILPEREFCDTWEPFFRQLLARSPGLRAYVLENPDFYAPELRCLTESLKPKVVTGKP